MKEIPLNNYYHFKSCIACTFYPGMDKSLLYVYDKLGIKYTNSNDQSSCMGFCYHCGIIPWETHLAVNARNLAVVEETNKDCVCVCPTSYGNLRECNDHLRSNPETLDRMNRLLRDVKRKYSGSVNIYHASEIILAHMDSIKKSIAKNLSGLRVATHHGCHYTKIHYKDIMKGTCENPTLLDEIVEQLGGAAVNYSEKTLCCGMGFYHTLVNRDYTNAISLRKLRSIKSSHPDLILTNCPGCIFTFDYAQAMFEENNIEKFTIPVMDYSELVALLLGADPNTIIGVKAHRVSLKPVLSKLGIRSD